MIRLKNREQLEGIRRSCRLLSDLYEALMPRVVKGANCLDLDAFAREFITKAGGKPSFLGYQGYPATLCISINEQVIHGIPADRVLQDGDLVGIDCGTILDGYVSDAAFTRPIGKIKEEEELLLKTTKEALELGIAQARKGNRISDISRAVFRHAVSRGFGVVHQYCGHGVGFSPHEDPSVPNYVGSGPNPRLVPGMVLALEPMINLGTGDVDVLKDDWTVVTRDRKASAHFEHSIAITDEGPEVLTAWSVPEL